MTNEPTTAAGKLTYSIEGLCRLVKTTREYQAEYRRLLVNAGKTGDPEDKAAGEKAYIHARSMEKILDQTIDEILADIAEEREASTPIGADTGIDWFIVYLISAFAVIVFMALWTMIDLTVALYFLGVTAVLVLIAAACFILFCHRQSKTDFTGI